MPACAPAARTPSSSATTAVRASICAGCRPPTLDSRNTLRCRCAGAPGSCPLPKTTIRKRLNRAAFASIGLCMHAIEPARLKPGVTVRTLPPDPAIGDTVQSPEAPAAALITGRALVFWDPKNLPGTRFARKLDAIDTDQITPATDCVSESLETLDERWKAGSFRYLMPDFRARVHRGENFVIAGDRFAIGSSREMSPAGLKGVAEEAGLQMVIVCGQNMGDIFRRNSFNLGLHVVQSPEAVADAQDGDELSFDPLSRQLKNLTRGKTYEPVPLSPKEEEIRRSGGHLRGRPARVPEVGDHPPVGRLGRALRRREDDDDRADHLGASRRQGAQASRSDARHDAARVRRSASGLRRHGAVRDPHLQPDHRRPRHLSAAGGHRQRSLRLHRPRRRRQADIDRPRVRAAARSSRSRTTRRPATASFTSTFPSRGS